MDYGELRRDRLDLLKLEDQKEGHRSVYTLASTSRKPKMPTPSECIQDLETQYGLTFQDRGEKLTLSCPLPSHADDAPSAVVFLNTGRFHCSVCTPGGSISLLELQATLAGRTSPTEPSSHVSVSKASRGNDKHPGRPRPLRKEETREKNSSNSFLELQATLTGRTNSTETPRDSPTSKAFRGNDARSAAPRSFAPQEVRKVWQLSLERAGDDERVSGSEEQATYAYLVSRGLAEAFEERLYGIVTSDLKLPDAVRNWPKQSYHLVVPLYDVETGELASIQARTIDDTVRPKTRFPRGARASGVVFANAKGLQVLRRERSGPTVVLGEGLTDYLALSLSSNLPVLGVPGVTNASKAIGPWTEGHDIRIAFDTDRAGEAVVPRLVQQIFRAGGRSVVRTRWPRGAKDACDALETLGAEGFAERIRTWERSGRNTQRNPGRVA